MAANQSAYQLHIHRSNVAIDNDQHIAELLQPAEILSHSYSLPPLKDFIGRQADVQRAITLWQKFRPQFSARAIAIVGQAGVGKSAFALCLAHQLKPLFPDAQIYLNLRTNQFASRGTVTQQLLYALSATELHQLSNRRILLLLDHLDDHTQLRPLLTLGASCTILVTSRQPFDDTATLKLESMSISDAMLLLHTIASSKSIQSEPKTAGAIVQLCDALPLPLRIVAGLLQSQANLQLSDCLRLLDEERQHCEQENLNYPAICASFNLSYQHLDADSARLLRLIGLLAEPTFTLRIAAALTETSIATAQVSIAQLLRLRLLESIGKERYRLHELLVRLVKRQLAIEESTEARQAARLRLIQAYQETAERISSSLGVSYQQTIQYQGQLSAAQVKNRVTFKQLSFNARSWFKAERTNLLAAIDWAIQADAWQIVLSTVVSVTQVFDSCGDRPDWHAILLTAIATAKRLGEPLQTAHLLNHLGNVSGQQANWEKAQEYYQQSLEILHELEEPIRESQTLANLGIVHFEQGEPEMTVTLWTAALLRLPAGSRVELDMLQWMQFANDTLLQTVLPQLGDRSASPNFLGTLSSILKRLIP